MRTITAALIAALALTACDAMEDSANRAGSGLKENYDRTREHVSKWIYRWEGTAEDAPPPKLLANAYCYRVQMDILCYEQPRMELGTRLVAYQGNTAYPPGYVQPVAVAPYSEAIVSYDVPPPFAVASPETMAKVQVSGAQVSGASGSSVSGIDVRPAGPPKNLMNP